MDQLLSGPLSILVACVAFLVMIWPGYALLHLVGLGMRGWPHALFAGPVLTLALWIVVLCLSVWSSLPVKQIAIPLWIGTLALGILGIGLFARCRRAVLGDSLREPWFWMAWAGAVAIPLVIMPASFSFGLADFANSARPDSWSYVAFEIGRASCRERV